MSETAVIIPCGLRKLKVRARAEHLYQGPYFKSNLKWALSVAASSNVFILSAKHGLLRLSTEIEPYNLKMGWEGSVDADTVKKQAESLGLKDKRIYALGGKEYLATLKAAGLEICAPVAGQSMGYSMKILKKNLMKLPTWNRF